MRFFAILRAIVGSAVFFLLAAGGAQAQDRVAQMRAYLSGATVRYYEDSHGAQIEYHAANGRSYLWYPGNTVILRGFWAFRDNELCYRYPDSGINPVTGEAGPEWSCHYVNAHPGHIRERARGDVLGLSRMTRPRFILPKEEISLGDLARMGRGRR